MTAAATETLPRAGLEPVSLRARVPRTHPGGAGDAATVEAAALALVEASERRLTRLAFDLHDGPVQDVLVLAAEVRLLRQELVDAGEHGAGAGRESVAARFDALEAQLLALGRELREVSSSLEPTKALRSVRDGLAGQVEAFRTQTGIRATLELAGDFESLTASQRIAVLRIVQEALANVREHSGATRVRVAASVADDLVRVEVTDDGRGFHVERAFAKAAREGRLGLVGMSERVRLLGGRMEIDSRPGGPTTISAVLELWEPVTRPDEALAGASFALIAPGGVRRGSDSLGRALGGRRN